MKDILIKRITNNSYLVYNPKSNIPLLFNLEEKKNFERLIKIGYISENSLHLNNECELKIINLKNELNKIGFFYVKHNLETVERDIASIKQSARKRVYLHVTDRCNLKCSYCFNEYHRKNFFDLSFNEWKIIINKIKDSIGTLVITGGEPFLYKDLNRLIKYILKTCKNIRIECFTNGNINFTKNNKENFETISLIDKLNISCDNVTNDDHERLGFSMLIFENNIKWILENGFGSKTSINSVISKGKLSLVKSVQEYAYNKGLEFIFAIHLPKNKGDRNNMLSISDYKKIIKEDFLKTKNVIKAENIPYTVKCSASSAIISVDSHGNCYPCQNFHFPEFKMGNLLTHSFEDINNSNISKLLKNHHILKVEGCKDCELRFVCGGGCLADTYKIHGRIDVKPEIMCPYYKIASIQRLVEIEYD